MRFTDTTMYALYWRDGGYWVSKTLQGNEACRVQANALAMRGMLAIHWVAI